MKLGPKLVTRQSNSLQVAVELIMPTPGFWGAASNSKTPI